MKNILLVLLGFILLTTPLGATAQQDGDFTYTSDGSAITITGYTGHGGAVTVPDTINGLPVTTVANYVFYNTTSLTSIFIPASVTSIGSSPFQVCFNLNSITVDAANASYSSVDGVLFNKTQTTLLQYPGGKAGSYAVPGSVTGIAVQAFPTRPAGARRLPVARRACGIR